MVGEYEITLSSICAVNGCRSKWNRFLRYALNGFPSFESTSNVLTRSIDTTSSKWSSTAFYGNDALI